VLGELIPALLDCVPLHREPLLVEIVPSAGSGDLRGALSGHHDRA